jgi:mRNA interferase YafQ
MFLSVLYGDDFQKAIKKAQKKHRNLDELFKVIDLLTRQEPLPRKYKNHSLSGDLQGCWECHIERDFLLIYQIKNNTLILVNLGSHDDLFKRWKSKR